MINISIFLLNMIVCYDKRNHFTMELGTKPCYGMLDRSAFYIGGSLKSMIKLINIQCTMP